MGAPRQAVAAAAIPVRASARRSMFEQAKEAQVRDNPMILLAWGENKEGQRQYAASTTGLGSGTGSTGGSTEDSPALAPNTVWGPGGLAGLTGRSTRRVDRRTGPIDAATHGHHHNIKARRRPAVSPPARQLAAGRSGQLRRRRWSWRGSERAIDSSAASQPESRHLARGRGVRLGPRTLAKASARPKAASAPASKPTAVSGGLRGGVQGGLQGGLQGGGQGGCRGLQGEEEGGGARACWIGVGAAGAPKLVVSIQAPATTTPFCTLTQLATDAQGYSAYHTLAKVGTQISTRARAPRLSGGAHVQTRRKGVPSPVGCQDTERLRSRRERGCEVRRR